MILKQDFKQQQLHWNDLNSGTNYTWGNYVHSWTVPLTFEDTFLDREITLCKWKDYDLYEGR